MSLTGCGGPSTPAATSGVSEAPLPDWDINETPRAELVGGEFTAAITGKISTWNPGADAGNFSEQVFLRSPILPSYYDYRGNGEAVMNTDYLLSVETKNDPNLEVTLNLNPLAVWNDGAPIGAADWIATWKALNGKNREFEVASTDGWDQIRSVRAGKSQHQVVLTFRSAYPDWEAVVSGGPQRAAGVADPQTFNSGWGEYVDSYFTGPYRVTHWDKVSGEVVMEPNSRWWGAKPLLTKLTWKLIKSEAAAAAFANQEIDYYDIGANPDGYAQAKAAPNSEVRTAAGSDFRQITFNSKSPNLADQTVRQAIVMGLDRQVIANSDLAGLPGEKKPLNNGLYLPNQPGYQDEALASGIDYNPERAKEVLAEAGWILNPETGIREKRGRQLSLNFVQFGGVAASENEALQAKQMLAQIGVEVNIVDVANGLGEVLQTHDFDLIAFTWTGSAYPLLSIGQVYGGTGSGKNFRPSYTNYAQLEVPGLQELKAKIDVETDPVVRADLGNQAALAIWESVHSLPLYQGPVLIGVRSGLANIGALGMARLPKWENVGYTKSA